MGPAPSAPRSAFTLIETLLTLAVLGLIAALIVPAMASLRWDAADQRAQAEVVAALADARSLARARSAPVLVSLRRAPDGSLELWGSPLDPANLGPLPGSPASSDEPSVAPAGRRLAILPDRCGLGPPKPSDLPAADRASAPAGAQPPDEPTADPAEPLQLAVVFPDGTALVPRTPIHLTVPQGPGKPDLAYRLAINPWFAEVQFSLIPPAKANDSPADSPAADAPNPEDARSSEPARAAPSRPEVAR